MGTLKGWQHCPNVTASWGHCAGVPSHAGESPLLCCAVGSLCPPTALRASREIICDAQIAAASMGIAGLEVEELVLHGWGTGTPGHSGALGDAQGH